MLTIGVVANATGSEFGKYLPEFYKYLKMGLQSFQEYQVGSITVGVDGDIVRALDDKKVAELCAQMDANDAELMEYDYQLKCSIFEAYSGILQRFKKSMSQDMLPCEPHLYTTGFVNPVVDATTLQASDLQYPEASLYISLAAHTTLDYVKAGCDL